MHRKRWLLAHEAAQDGSLLSLMSQAEVPGERVVHDDPGSRRRARVS
jgi:hypothetical protein